MYSAFEFRTWKWGKTLMADNFFDLSGKVVIVTGSTRGIGLAIGKN